jgi:hypothetical protein
MTYFREQWLGKTFWLVLGFLAANFLLAIAVFDNIETLVLIVIGIAILILTIWRLEYGILAAFAELFANSHGHLISTELNGFDLSLRQVIFLAVLGGWVFCGARQLRKNPVWFYFAPLLIAVVMGFIVGFFQNETAKVFNDGNGYFYLAYLLPILSIEWHNERCRRLLQTFAAAAIWVVFLTLGLLYEFTHLPAWMLARSYTFIRDTRTGELTRVTDSLFRIFLQAQFSPIFFSFFLAPWLWLKEMKITTRLWLTFGLSFFTATILIGLSRSFWVGIIVGLIPFIFLILKFIRPSFKKFISGGVLATASGIFGVIVLILIILFPLPYRMSSAEELSSLFSSRTSELGDAAISSRWNLLPEMWEEIKAAPLLGSGFGEEVTFKTDDPRARSISPDGTWTTFAFEWGWLDLWLKMGILGPLAFLWLFFGLLRGLLGTSERPNWLTIGLVSSLTALFITHIFSPYLNHPIGLGFILFVVPFLETEKMRLPICLPATIDLKTKTSSISSPAISRVDPSS